MIGRPARPIIDVETLEVYRSGKEVAKLLGVSRPCIRQSIVLSCKVKGRRLEYLEEWTYWTDKEKEKHTRKNNIFFYRGGRL